MNLLEIKKSASEIEIMIENGDFSSAAKDNATACLRNAEAALANDFHPKARYAVAYWLAKAVAHLVGILHPMHARISSLAK